MENWGWLIVLLVFGILIFVSFILGFNKGFQSGQIKALQGKFQYKLIEQSNGETRYQRVKEYDFLELED